MSCIPCSRCGQFHDSFSPCGSDPCSPIIVSSGCPIQLDFSCILYHKNNNQITQLDGLNLSNGTTLELFAETVDEKLKQLDVAGTTLPCLRASYVVNNLTQFMTAVDTALCNLQVYLGSFISDPLSPSDGQYWFRNDLGELRILLDGTPYKITITAV